MMLFKIPFRNIRRSLRDYAIYFFTLIIGVSVFYVFNAIGGQAAMLQVSQSSNQIVELLDMTLSGMSVFVAIVLALLIVYASRFLMKRRNREFALYMLMGMSKGRISAILFAETILVGAGSLVAGLILGIGLSQLMSAVVADLFEADMSAYKLSISGRAAGLTVLFFAVTYITVMILNSTAVARMKLIDLIQSGKRSEQIKLKNPAVCVAVFLAASVGLGVAYYQVGWNFGRLTQASITLYIGIGMAATLLIFWSVSGMLLRIVMSAKKMYFTGLNAFTFRQVSSKINTIVLSMTVICLMLFLSICSLASAFSIRNSLNENLEKLCPADIQIAFRPFTDEDGDIKENRDIAQIYSDHGYDITEGLREYVHFNNYGDPGFTLGVSMGSHKEEISERFRFLQFDNPEEIVRISDYNRLMELYGREPLELGENEFIVICDFNSMKEIRDEGLAEGEPITLFGNTLYPRYNECLDGFISLSGQHINAGVYLVPDDAVPEDAAEWDYLFGKYNADSADEKRAVEDMQREYIGAVAEAWRNEHEDGSCYMELNTKLDIYEASVGLGAIFAFLGLYIGIIFLIACGAILALNELSESVDSLPRYEMLRKIGADEKEISASLFYQTGIFFLLPLILAVIHSIFGMKFSTQLLETIGTGGMWGSIVITSLFLLAIYGGYFVITYLSSRGIIRDSRYSTIREE